MKKTVCGASTLRRCCVLLMAVMLLVSVLCIGSAGAVDVNSASRLNVMLVIDGSGSLTMNGGTDLKGHRYDAIDLFLALLTNDGNNVGAIVFDHDILLETPIEPISGKSDKLELSQKIRDAGTRGDTDIGGALLAAVDACKAATEKNGMQSVILLFSDGKTDLTYNGGEEAKKKSLEDKETATTNAQNADIPIHTICLNASNASDPAELEEIAQRTSGTFTAVSTARDLTGAFENFYQLIFPNSSNEVTNTTFSDTGELSVDIQIPSYGVEEVNVILDTEIVDSTQVDAPSGAYNDGQMADATMSGGFYDVMKLVDPEKGLWTIKFTGTPGSDVTVNILYNIDSAARLKTADGKTDYAVGETATLQTRLLHNGAEVTDSIVTQDYTAKLIIVDLNSGKEVAAIDMLPQADGMFACDFVGHEYASYQAKAELYCANLTLGSNEIPLNFGNTAPVARKAVHLVEQTVTPVSGKSNTVNVASFFSDAQDTQLTYSIVSNQLIQGTATLDSQTGTLKVNTGKSRSGDVVIQAMDSQGATAVMTVRYDVTNLTWLIFGGIIGIILLVLALLIGFIMVKANKPFKGMIAINDINGGIQRTHGGFRGKMPLERLGINSSGIVKGVLVCTGNNRVELRAKNNLYTTSGYQTDPKKITLSPGFNTIYADEEHTQGVEIDLQPSGY